MTGDAPINLAKINEWRDGAEVAVTVAAAVDAGIFRVLAAGGPMSCDELASRAGLDPRAVRVVVEALRDLDLVSADQRAVKIGDQVRRALGDPESPEYAGRGFPLWLENLRSWTALPEVLRTGKHLRETTDRESSASRKRFMAGMAATPPARVRRLVDRCLERHPAAESVLDLGGGPGLYSREFSSRGLTATMVDRPTIVNVVTEVYGLANVPGVTLVPADFMAEPLPAGPFDIVLLANVCHMYGPEANRALIDKVAGVTSTGGLVAVADFVRGRSTRAARFAIVMLLNTEEGDTYSEQELQSWLEGAGLDDVQIEDVDSDRQLVTARKE